MTKSRRVHFCGYCSHANTSLCAQAIDWTAAVLKEEEYQDIQSNVHRPNKGKRNDPEYQSWFAGPLMALRFFDLLRSTI